MIDHVLIDQTFGNYKAVGRVGEGGMGVVYEARHLMMGRSAAVKVLRPELARDKQAVGRFFNEARATSEIRHPGIVQIYDCGLSEDGSPWLVMELLDGESLGTRLAQVGTLPPSQVVDIAVQATSALAAAHAAGIIHRDLKPDNLFLVRDPAVPGGERLKVLDFGIAKLNLPGAANLVLRTGTGMLLGTPVYMSPEQCRGNKEIDARSDVYSLGLILYQMLAGEPPFVSDGLGDLLIMHISAEPVPLAERAPRVGAGLARIVHRALQKNPSGRQADMVDLQKELAALSAADLDRESSSARGPFADSMPTPARPDRAPELDDGRMKRFPPPGATTLSAGAVALGPKPTEGRRSKRIVAAMGVVAVAAGVAVAVSVLPRADPAPRPTGASTPAAPETGRSAPAPASAGDTRAVAATDTPTNPVAGAPDPAPPVAPGERTSGDDSLSISIKLTTLPAGARVVEIATGKVLGVTPLDETVAPGPGGLKLRVEKPGFAPRTMVVPPGRDYHQSFKLEKAGVSKTQEVIIKL